MSPDKYDNVNYKFYHNKDGKYAWRMFQLIHPAVYVYLVNMITSEDNWNFVKNKFNDYKRDANIICCSDLVESSSRDKDKGAIINRWWNELEQNSIKLSLEYEYIGITDVVDCYGSIYTHSIAWALHGRNSAKGNKEDMTLLGNKIDKTIRNMCYGQTNGIPQGSTLMDFIAEIVLGYGDTLISNRLEEENINNYKILRYRDDYRVFSNNRDELNEILKIISEELATKGVSEYLFTLINNIEFRADSNIIICKNDAKSYLEYSAPLLDKVSARYYEIAPTSSEYTGYTESITCNEFFSSIIDNFSQPTAILRFCKFF